MHVCLLRCRIGQATWPAPGGKDQMVIPLGTAIAEHHAALLPINGTDLNAGPTLNLQLVIRSRATDLQRVPVHLTRKIGLGQRRPPVRQLRLVANEDDASGIALLTQRRHQFGAGMAGADDNSGFVL
ncbi:hypothetical protein D9M70_545380 [compost metagenome]